MRQSDSGVRLTTNGFPQSFIKANPQIQNATFDTNTGHANYHSLQAQVAPSGTLAGAGTGERIVFPVNPDVNLTNPAPFGNLEGKIGGRTFQGVLRLEF